MRRLSRIRKTKSSKDMPRARAAIGTRLWSVMPGMVFLPAATSRRSGPASGPRAPIPLQPITSNAGEHLLLDRALLRVRQARMDSDTSCR
jgi:hypothetical protein